MTSLAPCYLLRSLSLVWWSYSISGLSPPPHQTQSYSTYHWRSSSVQDQGPQYFSRVEVCVVRTLGKGSPRVNFFTVEMSSSDPPLLNENNSLYPLSAVNCSPSSLYRDPLPLSLQLTSCSRSGLNSVLRVLHERRENVSSDGSFSSSWVLLLWSPVVVS